MSQSILVKGVYKNGKTSEVGLHNPQNNRTANDLEFKHLFDMFNKYIYTVSQKFKRIDILVWLQNGERIQCFRLDQAIELIKNDTV